MKLSVIICCLNAADTISNQLEALACQHWSGGWEIVVSDNGSTDASLAIVERHKEHLPNLRVVDSSDLLGIPHARNIGVLAAGGDAILFCDADDEVAPGWLEAMGRALSEHDFVACRIESKKLNEPWVQESRAGTQRDGLQKLPYPPYFPHAGTGTMGVKRSVHETVGGFDESFRFVSDAEYCLRIQVAGTKLHFVPEAAVHVRFRNTFRGIYRQARNYGHYSTRIYKKSRALGMQKLPRPWTDGFAAWARLLRQVRKIREKGGRAAWLFQLGYRIGRIRGSIKHRVLAI